MDTGILILAWATLISINLAVFTAIDAWKRVRLAQANVLPSMLGK